MDTQKTENRAFATATVFAVYGSTKAIQNRKSFWRVSEMLPEDDQAVIWLRQELKRWQSYSDDMPGKSAILSLLLRFEIETGISLSSS